MANAILEELNRDTHTPSGEQASADPFTPAHTRRRSENTVCDIDEDLDDDEAYFLDDDDDEDDYDDDDYDDDDFEEEEIDADVDEDYDDEDL